MSEINIRRSWLVLEATPVESVVLDAAIQDPSVNKLSMEKNKCSFEYLGVRILDCGDISFSECSLHEPLDEGWLPYAACAKNDHPVVVALLRHFVQFQKYLSRLGSLRYWTLFQTVLSNFTNLLSLLLGLLTPICMRRKFEEEKINCQTLTDKWHLLHQRIGHENRTRSPAFAIATLCLSCIALQPHGQTTLIFAVPSRPE